MADKKKTAEELKKLMEEGKELPEDAIDLVAGGAYTEEEWNAMTTEERQAAQMRSLIARRKGTVCELD